MHLSPNLRMYRHTPSSLRTTCSSRSTLGPSGNIKLRFVRAKSSKAKAAGAPEAPNATKTTSTLEASLRARAQKGDVPSEVEKEMMPWGEYLAVRKNKRRWETAFTIPLTIGGFAAGIATFGSIPMDPTKPLFNVDPMVVYGAAAIGCGGLGYLIGPIVGSTCWRFLNRHTMKLIEARDRQFHEHIIKNRVDPTAQSATNPVPDFYGEKIGSLQGYRQWLRDQAKYKRKAALPED